jgi:heme-degrading monooxygenase HmoA
MVMSVLVTMKVKGDTDQFRRFLETDADRLKEIAKSGQAAGAIHHRFGVGDGFVLVIDEWGSAEAFQAFIGSDEIAEVMRDAGAQSEPEIEFAEAVDSPDQF